MKLKRLGLVLGLTGLVALGAGSLLYTRFRFKQDPSLLAGSKDPSANEKARGEAITLIETQAGQKKWVLKVQKIQYTQQNALAHLEGVSGTVYGDDQKVLFTVTSPAGEYTKKNSRVTLTKGVRMVSPSADIMITAPKMVWSSKNNVVKATGGITMIKKGLGSTRANEAVFLMDFSRVRFEGETLTEIGSPPNTGRP